MPKLEAAIKEALRLHPPLIILLRVAKVPLEVGGYTIQPRARWWRRQPVGVEPRSEAFADAEAFDPDRYLEPREDDVANPWSWIPFGAGRHRCVGAAFAMMQLKAIFSVLLRDCALRADPAARDLLQRPLEDGRAARPAVRRPDDPR